MTRKTLTIVVLGILFVWANSASENESEQAKKFPGGALVYLQTGDFAQLLNQWNQSKIKNNSSEKNSIKRFSNTHLGIKLAERFADYGMALGFDLDTEMLSTLCEKRAALALYDIGKLEFVLITPMNEEAFSATMFMQNPSKFSKIELGKGATVFYLEMEVDRERQKQTIFFTNYKGNLILATSRKYLEQTLSIIEGKSTIKSLYDEDSFIRLRHRIIPNLASVWVNQERLNRDYYFKRYWLPRNTAAFDNILAGIFDLDINETGLTERREFLLKEPKDAQRIGNSEANDLLEKLPDEMSYFNLRSTEDGQLGDLVYQTILDHEATKPEEAKPVNYSSSYASTYSETIDYENLNSDFDRNLNETEIEQATEKSSFSTARLNNSLVFAKPTHMLFATKPQILAEPAFLKFEKILIVKFQNPAGFDSKQFEESVADAVRNRLVTANAKFVWGDIGNCRSLQIPTLGWEIVYRLQDDKLFISNSLETLTKVLANKSEVQIKPRNIDCLKVVKLDKRDVYFDTVMRRLATDDSDEFFDTVAGFLDLLKGVKQIEVSQKSEGVYLHEEISVRYADPEK